MRKTDQERVNDITRIPVRTNNDIKEALESHMQPLKSELLNHNANLEKELTYLKVKQNLIVKNKRVL